MPVVFETVIGCSLQISSSTFAWRSRQRAARSSSINSCGNSSYLPVTSRQNRLPAASSPFGGVLTALFYGSHKPERRRRP